MFGTIIKSFSLCFFMTMCMGVQAENNEKIQDRVREVLSFKHVTIKSITTYKGDYPTANRVEIYPNIGDKIDAQHTSKLLNPWWTLAAASLPVTETICNKLTIDLCDEVNMESHHGGCFKPCLLYGPEYVAFDEKSNKLYLSVKTTSIGSGGGPIFTFAADLNSKKVKFLNVVLGPVSGSLSPAGTNLVLYGKSVITVVNTDTGEDVSIGGENDWDSKHLRLHHLDDIKWFSENQFQYRDGIRHSKFQDSYDEMSEKVFDISSKKIISDLTPAQ